MQDQPLVAQALEDGVELVPLFVVNPAWVQPGWMEMASLGPHRKRFLWEALADLRQSFQALGRDLHLLMGAPAEVIPAFADLHGVERVYAQDLPGVDEQKVFRALREKLEVVAMWEHTLLEPPGFPLPDVFTVFRKKVEQDLRIKPPISHTWPVVQGEADEHLWTEAAAWFKYHTYPTPDPRRVMDFKGGETAGWAHVEAYFADPGRATTYKETRNGMLEAGESTKFSPWLAQGSISARQVYARLKEFEGRHGANDSTYWIFFELLWRDFFQFSARERGASLFATAGWNGSGQKNRESSASFQAWCEGKTGVPFVDAHMRELLHTGWMSNRGRQVVASWLVHEAGVDWRLGAAWFEHRLLDYDVASNYGNWQYVAGVGHDPRPDRRFNVRVQAERYDPDGRYQARWST